jgi:hypothetical protein
MSQTIRKRRLGAALASAVVALAVVAGLTSGAASAALTSVSGNAYGAGVTVNGNVQIDLTANRVTNPPPTGPTNFAAIDVSPLVKTGAITVEASGTAATGPTSNATVASLDVAFGSSADNVAALALTATAIHSECHVDTNGTPTGSTTLGSISGTIGTALGGTNSIVGLTTTPTLNTVVPISITDTSFGTFTGTITLNEQTIGTNSIAVNAIHIHLNANATNQGADYIIGHSECAAVVAAVAVGARAFDARVSPAGVLLRWKGGAQANLLGFNVYRQKAGKRVRVNTRLIRASVSGRYAFVDRTLKGTRAAGARYWLQAVNLDGSRSWVGSARIALR